MKIQNPHDKFFKKTFGNVVMAEDFISNYLPQSIVNILDLDTLEPQKDSYIDERLEESFSDLLFKVKFNAKLNKREGYLYLLFEHKSYPSRDIAFQLLKYIVRIWEVKYTGLGNLPVIIPLVIYHGKEGWNIGNNLENLILDYDDMCPRI